MRSRRGYPLPPETGKQIGTRLNCKALCLAFFLPDHLVRSTCCQITWAWISLMPGRDSIAAEPYCARIAHRKPARPNL